MHAYGVGLVVERYKNNKRTSFSRRPQTGRLIDSRCDMHAVIVVMIIPCACARRRYYASTGGE